MKDFFATQPKGTRGAYYTYKPRDYVWPNASHRGRYNRTPSTIEKPDDEIPIFELPDYQQPQEPIKAEIRTDSSLAAKIEAILKLGEMIKEL